MPYATYRFNKIIAAETIRFIVTVAIVVYKGLKLVVYRMLTKCHVIVDLKIDKFHHEYASQLNMYLNYFKAEVMQPDDNPPIGILLCTEKGDTLVRYATAGLDPNIFVQKYKIQLPSEEEFKRFLSKEIG